MKCLLRIDELAIGIAWLVPRRRCLESVQYQNVILTDVEIVLYRQVPLSINLFAIWNVVAFEYSFQQIYLPSECFVYAWSNTLWIRQDVDNSYLKSKASLWMKAIWP